MCCFVLLLALELPRMLAEGEEEEEEEEWGTISISCTAEKDEDDDEGGEEFATVVALVPGP